MQDCDGGIQEASLVRSQNAPTTIGELPSPVPLANSLRTFTTPTGDTDQVRILFTAEAAVLGERDIPNDGMSIEIRLDGVPLPNPTDLAFSSGSFAANAAMVCRRVSAGTHTVEIYWQVVDAAADGVLTGRLDDWTLDIEINN